MKLKFLFPYWSCESTAPENFIAFCLQHNFDGIEVNFPTDAAQATAFRKAITAVRKEKPDFKIMAQQVLSHRTESASAYTERLLERLNFILEFEPDSINSLTGKDSFTFDENCNIIAAVEAFEQKHGVPILHEIHRGRFTFHAATLLPYLTRFPTLKLTGDFSHWCLVSESLLEDQMHHVMKAIPHIHHLHARVGTEQASQANDPFAPEWKNHVDRFMQLWQTTLDYHIQQGKTELSITPEFGPFPYMPQSPFDQKPLGDQTAINLKMKALLLNNLNY
ncbi:MAG: sugar phosphate isomerase/epimerase [Salibacteraceae bacterium]|nr:sugar phosphate isomerase/epimerase [Salibacteraceae bacterium]